jgi:hypothetical protein
MCAGQSQVGWAEGRGQMRVVEADERKLDRIGDGLLLVAGGGPSW